MWKQAAWLFLFSFCSAAGLTAQQPLISEDFESGHFDSKVWELRVAGAVDAEVEQGEAAQREVARATQEDNAAKKQAENQIAELNQREANLKQELAELQSGRAELAAAVEEVARLRYERLYKSKGDNVVVGIQHGVCGGCHMKLPAQTLVTCRSQLEIVGCINCGRILYYTRDMALAVAE